MEFRKMVTITLYARHRKRHRCIEQFFGLWKRARVGWFGRNMYIIICEMVCQSRFDAWDMVLGASALGWPRGMRWGGGFRMGNTSTPLVDPCQCMAKPIQYCKVISLQKKKKKKRNWNYTEWYKITDEKFSSFPAVSVLSAFPFRLLIDCIYIAGFAYMLVCVCVCVCGYMIPLNNFRRCCSWGACMVSLKIVML